MPYKPTIVLDFDGVIHGYTSGWKGARVIPDPPVPGALEFIVTNLDRFEIAILSSRSHQFGGRRAMKRYLRDNLTRLAAVEEDTPDWLMNRILQTVFADPWRDEVDFAVKEIIREIKWPLFKPAALLTIDDRAWTFNGTFPSADDILSFKPWYK